jgi:threonine/homoserine/homoserine lactone efflux protein
MISLFIVITGLFLGLSMAAPPGPVMAMILKKSMDSVKSGFLIGMGAMTADLILLAIVYTLNKSVNLKSIMPEVFLLGGLYFIYLSLNIFLELTGKRRDTNQTTKENSSYLKGLTTGILNPMQIGWWLTAGLSILDTEGITPYYFFYMGIIIYVYVICILINKSYGKFEKKVSYSVNIFSILILFTFGLYFIYSFIIAI